MLTAPTGKAARRIFEQSGIVARTIHKLLEPQKTNSGFVFSRNANNPISVDVIVLNEVLIFLIHSLFILNHRPSLATSERRGVGGNYKTIRRANLLLDPRLSHQVHFLLPLFELLSNDL